MIIPKENWVLQFIRGTQNRFGKDVCDAILNVLKLNHCEKESFFKSFLVHQTSNFSQPTSQKECDYEEEDDLGEDLQPSRESWETIFSHILI